MKSTFVSKLALASLSSLGLLLTTVCGNATSLNGFVTADDAFTLYISQDPTTLGTAITSGSSFATSYSVSGGLVAGVTNYIQIVATNSFGDASLLGDFTLSDSQFQFANGTQSLLTNNSTDWKGNLQGASWSQPTGTVVDEGTNSNATTVWFAFRPGAAANISGSAEYIWPTDGFVTLPSGALHACGDAFNNLPACTVDFLAEIDPVATTPLPAALPLFASGLGGLGLLGWRRKRRALAA